MMYFVYNALFINHLEKSYLHSEPLFTVISKLRQLNNKALPCVFVFQ